MTENNITMSVEEIKTDKEPLDIKEISIIHKPPFINKKTQPMYRSKKERQEEVKNIILQLSKANLNTSFEPIKKLYVLFKKYINESKKIYVNIPFPEIKRIISGVLPIEKSEKVAMGLINN